MVVPGTEALMHTHSIKQEEEKVDEEPGLPLLSNTT
jgi:hypothetical protein